MNKYIANFKKYQFLLMELVKKDIKLKYRRSKLGILWTLIEPILTTIVLTFVFSFMKGKGEPAFGVYILTGRLVFQFFSGGTKAAARSIRSNSGMMRKVYVPKYMYPLASVLSNFITFLISLIVLVGALVIFRVKITYHVFAALPPLIILIIFTLGVSMILATAEVFFRDMEYLWGVLTTLIMYCSCIFFPIEKVPGSARVVIKCNPVYCVINNFRRAVYYGQPADLWSNCFPLVAGIILLGIGMYAFYKKQDEFILHL